MVCWEGWCETIDDVFLLLIAAWAGSRGNGGGCSGDGAVCQGGGA